MYTLVGRFGLYEGADSPHPSTTDSRVTRPVSPPPLWVEVEVALAVGVALALAAGVALALAVGVALALAVVWEVTVVGGWVASPAQAERNNRAANLRVIAR
jgi:hypothetical protein